MYDCLYYWPIAPIRDGISDTPDREPAFRININDELGKEHELALYCDSKGDPQYARLEIKGLNEENLPDSYGPMLQEIKEHLLTSLRMTFQIDVMFAFPSAWTFIKQGQPKQTILKVEYFLEKNYNPQSTKDAFVSSFEIRETMRLYTDGCDDRIPLQYRFLSFYKLLELEFRPHGKKWHEVDLALLIQNYSSDFTKAGFEQEPIKLIHELRDKCAHIVGKKKGRRQITGVTHLNYDEILKIEKIMPILRAICAVVVNNRAKGKVIIKPEVIQEGWHQKTINEAQAI